MMINMTITNDEDILLDYIYKCELEGKEIPKNMQLSTKFGLNEDRLYDAIEHLMEGGFITGSSQKQIGKRDRPSIGNITDFGIIAINAI